MRVSGEADKWLSLVGMATSKGWPGEAIGGLNLYDIRAKVDFDAVWRGAYRIEGISIDHGDITLLKPNDALKRPVPPKKP